MNLDLNFFERITLRALISETNGDVPMLRMKVEIDDILDFSDEERQKFSIIENGMGNAQWQGEELKSCEFTEAQFKYLEKEIQTFPAWPGLYARQIVALANKFKVTQ